MGTSPRKNLDHTIDSLRAKMAQIGGLVPVPDVPTMSPVREVKRAASTVPVVAGPEWLSGALDAGGVPRAGVTAMADCPAVHVDMLAAVTRDGGCVAVVGYPRLAVAAVEAAGGDLERMIVVPDPAPHAMAVLGTLVEGLDMVLFAPASPVTPTFARPVEARLHKSACALLVTGHAWPRARLNIDVAVTGVVGLGRGSGRIRGVEIEGRAWGKSQPPCTFRTVVGESPLAFMSDATPATLREVAQ